MSNNSATDEVVISTVEKIPDCGDLGTVATPPGYKLLQTHLDQNGGLLVCIWYKDPVAEKAKAFRTDLLDKLQRSGLADVFIAKAQETLEGLAAPAAGVESSELP